MKRLAIIVVAAALPFLLGACQPQAKTETQNGPRGSGMDTIKLADTGTPEAVPTPPYDPPGTDGPRARDTYQNVQVLGDVSADQFNYTMAAITNWIAPKEGCNYCHNPANMASDEKYTKVVARRMLQMTRGINGQWSDHVGQVGVTCYTCHRGQAVPSEHWTMPAPDPKGIKGNRHGQDDPVYQTAYSSLPTAAVAKYLLGDASGGGDPGIRVISTGVHPSDANTTTVMGAEPTYSLMMHISQSLGVNCTFCHNTQAFGQWSISNPQRKTAWYGIRMVRDINGQYISSLTDVFPPNRKGTQGDPYKANCATCHRGQNKPLGGYPMAKDYPALWGGKADAPASGDAAAAATGGDAAASGGDAAPAADTAQ